MALNDLRYTRLVGKEKAEQRTKRVLDKIARLEEELEGDSVSRERAKAELQRYTGFRAEYVEMEFMVTIGSSKGGEEVARYDLGEAVRLRARMLLESC
ncbi:MAG: hypothetical protein ABIH76_02190 [Candidatus Bathyarchaeota archaeon]